jgi:hypothetical protein
MANGTGSAAHRAAAIEGTADILVPATLAPVRAVRGAALSA